MTKERAITVACEFIRTEQIKIADITDVRRMSAEKFNQLYGYEKYTSDFWVIEFGTTPPDDVLVQSPGCVLIVVEDHSERANKYVPGNK